MSRISFWVILLGPFLLSCGGSKHPSSAAARDFMEAYYVKADLKAAGALADGLALEKVQGSEKLRADLAADAASPPEAEQRRVSFKLINSKVAKVDGASATYLYRVEICPKGGDPIRKKTLLRVREGEGGAWKVSQFSDHEDDGS